MFSAKKKSIVIILVVASWSLLQAQDINREVFVVRPYEPTLSDAEKYNFLPSINTLESTTPQFQYSISPKRFQSSFEPEPIKAARTVTTSLPKIYNSWLKLGLGNYSTPLVEFNISNLRSKESSYGAFMYHKSSYGKIQLENNARVNAGYVDNIINIYGNRFFSGVTLSGQLNFEQHAFNYYGYNTDTLILPIEIETDSIRQRIYKPGFVIGLKSENGDDDFNFDAGIRFDYFADRFKNKEPQLIVNTGFTKGFAGIIGGLDLKLNYSKTSGLDTVSNTIFHIYPWVAKSSEDWQFRLGFEIAADIADITNYYFYPHANLDIIVVKDVLIPFVGVSGELQKNNYQNLFDENMYIRPGLSLKNTSSNFIAFGGIKGNISSMIRFRADARLTIFKNYHFYINDTLTAPSTPPLHNKFTAVYDDINLITYHGQVVVAPGDKFEIMLDGNYYDYKTFEELKPWHKPDYNIKLDAKYRLNQLEFGAGFNIIGNRWVRDFEYPDNMKKLRPVFDGNLSINYHYSKLLTIFADFYNLAERSYQIWNQYPTQRFNFLLGLSYKL
ncbi:MAG TPA: hypothetical protein VHI78_13850 [Bacteroidales bacterium]|nr:hypothetical protein [Bacteroidales bacterium]